MKKINGFKTASCMLISYLTLLLLFVSCEKVQEGENPPSNGRLKFNVSQTDSWTTAMQQERSGGKENMQTQQSSLSETFVLQGTSMNDSVFLHKDVSRGIDPIFSETATETRACPVEQPNEFYDSFGLFAFAYEGAWHEALIPDYIYNEQVTKSSNWTTKYYWPVGKNLKFFAYAPYNHDGLTLSGPQEQGAPTFTYRVSSDVSKQKDLMVANAEGSYSGSPYTEATNLGFQHILTAVKFVAGDIKGGTIKTITLHNVKMTGDYDMDGNRWEINPDDKESIVLTLDKQISSSIQDPQPISTPNQTLMLLPGTLSDDVLLEVVIEDAEGSHTLTASLAGHQWMQGSTVIYTISTKSINWENIILIPDELEYTFLGGEQFMSIQSYRQNDNQLQQPLSWKLQFSTDGGSNWSDQAPDWLSTSRTEGAGSTWQDVFEVTVDQQIEITESNTHIEALKSDYNAHNGHNPENLGDLNSQGASLIGPTTANCYYVNGYGYYCFSAIFGNAWDGRAENTNAYKYAGNMDTKNPVLKNFMYSGGSIQSASIPNGHHAELVWQDGPNLITDLHYNANSQEIEFRILKDNIRPGNAVIALKDEQGVVLWSWHIWVTDYDLYSTTRIKAQRGGTYDYMPVALGQVPAYHSYFNARECMIKVVQSLPGGGTNEKITVVKQTRKDINADNNAPYYQWGRKDPFPPTYGPDTWAVKYYYRADGTLTDEVPKVIGHATEYNIEESVAFPFNLMQAHPKEFNLWSANECEQEMFDNDPTVVKTVYDPCPVGFSVPPPQAFSGFAQNPDHWQTTEINGVPQANGIDFYSWNDQTTTIYFPITSAYSYGKINHGRTGFYWSAFNARILQFGVNSSEGTYVNTKDYKSRGDACMIRPIRNWN